MKKQAFLATAVMLLFSLTACSGKDAAPQSISSKASSGSAETSTGSSSSSAAFSVISTDPRGNEPIDDLKAAVLMRAEENVKRALFAVRSTTANIEKPSTGKTPSPYEVPEKEYDSLTDRQKMLYDEMLPKVRDIVDFEYPAAEYGYDVLDDVLIVMGAIREDYPEYELYFSILEEFEGDMTSALRSNYFFPSDPEMADADKDMLRAEMKIFDAMCDYIVENIPRDLPVYDQYRYLAAYISYTTEYDHAGTGGAKVATAYGALTPGCTSICQGYSRGLQYLCRKANLFCKMVEGQSEGEGHAWNLVKLDTGTYHVDVTWSDDGINDPADFEWLNYFMLTQDEIEIDHIIEDGTVATGV